MCEGCVEQEHQLLSGEEMTVIGRGCVDATVLQLRVAPRHVQRVTTVGIVDGGDGALLFVLIFRQYIHALCAVDLPQPFYLRMKKVVCAHGHRVETATCVV